MKNFEILLDTTADLDKSFQEEYGIRAFPGHLTVDGRETDSFLEWTTTSREAFYASLKADPERYKTSPPSVGEMAQNMERCVAEGAGVLYITISGGLSGTFNFANQAKAMVLEKYPEAEIECVDSRRFGPAIGLMAVNASRMRAEGRSLGEVAETLNATKNQYHQAGWLDDLSYVAKQGRLTHSKAFFGTLIGVKPIGEFDYNGLTTVLSKAKGEKNALNALISYIQATIVRPEEQILFIAQTDRLKQAEKFKAMIEETIRPKAVYIKDVFPSCGVNIGPGLMAAYYIGNEISADLSVERDLLNKFLGGA